MAIANPTMHASAGADGLARLIRDVRNGRAQWTHPQHVRASTDELVRAAEALASAVQEMTAALARLDERGGAQLQQTHLALHQAAQGATTAAAQLRAARRFMH